MVVSQDDIVLSLRLGPDRKATAPVRAREERRLSRAQEGKRGIFSAYAKQRAARGMTRTARRRRSGMRRLQMARGAPAMRGMGSVKNASMLRSASAVGLIATAVVTASLVASRLITGRSTENMGQQVNNLLLGDLDEQARAKMESRQMLSGNSHIARAAAFSGGPTDQMKHVFDAMVKERETELRGIAAINTEKHFQSDSMIDQLAVRFAALLKDEWNAIGGESLLRGLKLAYLAWVASDPRRRAKWILRKASGR